MPRRSVPLAERFRAARESFDLAMQMGCLPAEAREARRREDADRQWRESGERLLSSEPRI